MAEFFIAGPSGRIEGRIHRSENERAPMVVVLHPNPMQGGTMNNRVTYALFQAFVALGFSVVRFNYAGVGNSQGRKDGTGVGEMADTIAVLDWLQSVCNESRVCWIAGYSFGAYVGAQVLMRRPEIKGFVFASVPTNLYSFDFLSPSPASGLILQGEKDEIIDSDSTLLLAEQLDSYNFVQVEHRIIKGADHFFTNKLKAVYDTVLEIVPELKSVNPETKAMKKKKRPIMDDY